MGKMTTAAPKTRFFSAKFFSPGCLAALPCMALFFLASCMGASMDITIRPNGSGRIVVEYRVSQALESIGRLDGNERWPAIPVGRADMERSVARVPGLRLSSFSSRDRPNGAGGRDLVTRATLNFSSMEALLGFLDITGSRAAFAPGDGSGSGTLRLVVLDPSPPLESRELLSLIREVSAGYEISIRVRAPRDIASVALPDYIGPARVERGRRDFSLAIGTGDIPAFSDGLYMEIFW